MGRKLRKELLTNGAHGRQLPSGYQPATFGNHQTVVAGHISRFPWFILVIIFCFCFPLYILDCTPFYLVN